MADSPADIERTPNLPVTPRSIVKGGCSLNIQQKLPSSNPTVLKVKLSVLCSDDANDLNVHMLGSGNSLSLRLMPALNKLFAILDSYCIISVVLVLYSDKGVSMSFPLFYFICKQFHILPGQNGCMASVEGKIIPHHVFL